MLTPDPDGAGRVEVVGVGAIPELGGGDEPDADGASGELSGARESVCGDPLLLLLMLLFLLL